MTLSSFTNLSKHLKYTVVAIAAVVTCAICEPVVNVSHAADAAKEKPKKKKKRSYVLSEYAYKKLEKSQKHLAEEEFKKAESILKALADRSSSKPYDQAMAWQTLGFAYAGQERYQDAVGVMKKALAKDVLSDRVTQSLLYNIASFYLVLDNYREALKHLDQWFLSEEKPKPEAYMAKAQCHTQLQEYRKALVPAKKAIALKEKPIESWYNLLLSLHWQLKEYKNSVEVAKKLTQFFPQKKRYWTQLSQLYAKVKDNKNALAALELAHKQGYLTTETEIKTLASYYLFLGTPYYAADVVQKAIEKELVEPTEANWRRVANSWASAKEIDKAIFAYGKAAPMSASGEFYVRQGELYLDKEAWERSIKSFNLALKKGKLKNAGQVYLNRAIAKLNLDQFTEARVDFRRVEELGGKLAKTARQWLAFTDQKEKLIQLIKQQKSA